MTHIKQIEIEDLTPDQLKQLEQKIADKKLADANRIKSERENYKSIVSNTVGEQIKVLHNVSDLLSLAKADIYRQFAAIIELKQELYGSKSGQMSHTFTDDEGHSITIGWRVVDTFDDTLDQGIAKVREYIESLAIDDNSANLVDMINKLLKKDAKGNLKANRILDLQNLADKEQNPLLIEGVTIIRESYKPAKSVIFIEAEQVDQMGKKQPVCLSITSVDFPEGYTPNLEVFK
jgi:hypothetical protein